MVCPYSNAGYEKCYVTKLTPENKEKATFYCGAGGHHKSCSIYPELVDKDKAALSKRDFLGNGPVLLPEPSCNHLLLFYQNTFNKMQVFVPFLLDGIAKNEKCLYFPMEDYPSQVRIFLNAGGVPSEKVEILPAAEWYLTDGVFNAEASQRKYEEAVQQAKREGYAGLRAIGDGGTVLSQMKTDELDTLLAYEERMHHLLEEIPMQAICAYDLRNLPLESFRRLTHSHHIFGTPLLDRQLVFLSHFIPSLDVEEIAYHVAELEEGKLKFVRFQGGGYLFCEAPLREHPALHALETPRLCLEFMVDDLSHRLIQGVSGPN